MNYPTIDHNTVPYHSSSKVCPKAPITGLIARMNDKRLCILGDAVSRKKLPNGSTESVCKCKNCGKLWKEEFFAI